MGIRLWTAAAVALLLSTPARALTPPWERYQALLHASVGADRCVHVGPVEAGPVANQVPAFVIKVAVCDAARAQALGRLLRRTVPFGTLVLQVEVADQAGSVDPAPTPALSAAEARALVAVALADNPFFRGAAAAGRRGSGVWVEFSKAVVQYYGDNLADRYGDLNAVAAEAFGTVLDLTTLAPVTAQVTTARD